MDILNKDVLKSITKVYHLDSEYLPSDGSDYGITINRIIANMSSWGGVIFVGNAAYEIKTKVTINKPVNFIGLGQSDFHLGKYISAFYTNSATLTMFEVVAGGMDNWEKIHFLNTNPSPTSGCAIRRKGLQDGTINEFNAVTGGGIFRCSFNGFYDNVMFDGAAQWAIENTMFYGAVRHNVYIDNVCNRDSGDSRIVSCDFYSKVPNRILESHIYHKGSGGLKVTTTKFNGLNVKNCIVGEIVSTTVILLVSNCSFENYKISAIKYSKTADIFRHINISNCEFDSYVTGSIDIDISSGITDINIIGNSFSSGVTNSNNIAIKLNGVDNVLLGNTYKGYTTPISVTNSTNVQKISTTPIY